MELDNTANGNEASPSQPRRLLSVREVAEIVGVRPQTVYNLMSKRLFPIKRVKFGRLVKFDTREVDRYLDSLRKHR
jgi:excisionase family DNA binding protein